MEKNKKIKKKIEEVEEKEEKKIKILREFVNAPFKEIKAEEKEENLEEELEEKEEEMEFPEIFEGDRIVPILKSSEETSTETTTPALERELEKIPTSATTTGAAEQVSYESVYNMPQYSYEKRVSPIKTEMQKAGFLVRQEEIKETKTRAPVEDWHEIRQGGRTGGEIREDRVIEAENIDRRTKQPWESTEERRKYRRRL